MSALLDYPAFLEGKVQIAKPSGIQVDIADEFLFPFQRYIASWMLALGHAAGFADTGLGKTRIELVCAREVAKHTGLPVLILCPLAVTGQTIEEGKAVGIDVGRLGSGSSIEIANYDRLKDVDPAKYGGVILDESGILKNFNGATRNLLVDTFSQTPFRFCFTATPAPNDHTELGNHAEFLGIMAMQGMLSRWFVHDSMNTSEWRLKGHAEGEFWAWVSSWAICLRKPSDIGFEDGGYDLPPLDIIRHTVETDAPDGVLIADAKLSATSMHSEMRRTATERAECVAKIVAADPDEPWLVWCNTDYEAEALRLALPDIVEVAGPMKPDKKESLLLGFAHGKPKRLLSKPSICGHGMNWQHCRRMAFVGLSYSYEQLYQAMRRCWRFGQTEPVQAHIVTADSEWSLLESIDRKRESHEQMVAQMVALMNQGIQCEDSAALATADAEGADWGLLAGDCVDRIKDIETGSVGYSIFSPPFASLYTYTDAPEDMGNCASDEEFFAHFEFLVPELLRVLKPGRLVSMHCMDLPSTKERDGVIALRDFPGEIIRLFERYGFVFHSRVTIWKDPLLAMQRTKALGLIHKQLVKDSAMSRQGIADYLITMRAPGVNLEPIQHGAGFDRYVGQDEPLAGRTDDPKTNKYGHEVWQRYASPVWMDIDPTDVLPYKGARTERDERHICPLQLQVIERGIELWSNRGDLVLDPFNGVGSTGYRSLQAGRKYVGIELKQSYFDQAVRNLNRVVSDSQGSLDLECAS